MTQVTNVSYRLGKSNDPKYCEVIASFKYKGKRREYYIFVKKNPKYKPNSYLKAAQKQFAIDLKNGKVADAYMHKAPLIVLATAFAATAIVFGALIVKKYIPQQGEGITFDVGSDATLELYDEKQISFPIQSGGVSWDSFYKDHHYFGAVKNGYDFLYWSLDGKNPIDNNYIFTEPVKLVPVFHENTDGVSFILRHIPNNVVINPDDLPYVSYSFDGSAETTDIKVRKNYGEWSTYEKTSDTEFARVGDVISFRVISSNCFNKMELFNVDFEKERQPIFAVSGDTKNLVGGESYKDNTFDNAFSGSPIRSASGLTISGDELPTRCCIGMFTGSNLVFSPKILASKMNDLSCASMFAGCTSLLVAPELPATTLASECYQAMFAACNSLIKAPSILPATTLEYACYRNMFTFCTSLIAMPTLPATTTVISCYESMFSNCSSLTKVCDLLATKRYRVNPDTQERIGDPEEGLAESCYHSMFQDCVSLTDAPYIFASKICCDVENSTQFNYMFSNCSSLSSIKMNYAGNFNDKYGTRFAFSQWASKVGKSGTFYYNGNASLVERGPDSIPNGWTVKKF